MKYFVVVTLSLIIGFMLGWGTTIWTAKQLSIDAGKFSSVIRHYADHNPEIKQDYELFDVDSLLLSNYCYGY